MAHRQRTGIVTAAQSVLTDDPDFLRFIVERVIQEILEAEMAAHLHADLYERTATRTGYRNGSKPRHLNTRVGTLSLQVPQDRDGTFSTQLFARYQRNEKAIVLALMEMYVEGVSTRNVRAITEALCGTSFSKSLVSELAGQLDAELGAWCNRPLTETTYPYLSVDARYEHVRQGGQIVSQGVLIVAGVRADGHREILAVAVADTESEATYHQVFRALKERGLSGVRLVTSDDHRG
jgi:putative transposase